MSTLLLTLLLALLPVVDQPVADPNAPIVIGLQGRAEAQTPNPAVLTIPRRLPVGADGQIGRMGRIAERSHLSPRGFCLLDQGSSYLNLSMGV